MTHVNASRVKQATSSTGTGSFTLDAPATGYRGYQDVGVDGDTFFYAAENGSDPTEWETGIGTLASSGTVLARTTVLDGTAGPGVPTTFSNAPLIWLGLPGERITGDQVGGAGGATLYVPVAADFATWINQNSASVSDLANDAGVQFDVPVNSTNTNDLTAVYKDSGFSAGADFTWEAKFLPLFAVHDFNSLGIFVYEVATGKSINLTWQSVSSVLPYILFYIGRHTNQTFGADLHRASLSIGFVQWIRIRIASGTIYFEASPDNENDWFELYSESLTSHFTTGPDKVGFASLANTSPMKGNFASARVY